MHLPAVELSGPARW
jgi:hypothetical protein